MGQARKWVLYVLNNGWSLGVYVFMFNIYTYIYTKFVYIYHPHFIPTTLPTSTSPPPQDIMLSKMVVTGPVSALAISPNGNYAVAAIFNKIHIWQVCMYVHNNLLRSHTSTHTYIHICIYIYIYIHTHIHTHSLYIY